MSVDLNLTQLIVWVVLAGVGIIAWFIKGMIAQQKKDNEISRSNDREIYVALAKEKADRLEMYIEILKDQRDLARSGKP